MSPCRYGWYQGGRVTRYVPGRRHADVPAGEPSAPAILRHTNGILLIEADIDGSAWFGRLLPRKDGSNEGIVILFKSTLPARQ